MEWLREFFNKIFYWVPRIFIIDPDESAVLVKRGKISKVFNRTGGHIGVYWPLWTSIRKEKNTPHWIDLPNQSITDYDGSSIAISATLKLQIMDIESYCFKVESAGANIQTACMSYIAKLVNTTPNIWKSLDTLSSKTYEILHEEARECGYDLLEVGITDSVKHRAIRLMLNARESSEDRYTRYLQQ